MDSSTIKMKTSVASKYSIFLWMKRQDLSNLYSLAAGNEIEFENKHLCSYMGELRNDDQGNFLQKKKNYGWMPDCAIAATLLDMILINKRERNQSGKDDLEKCQD